MKLHFYVFPLLLCASLIFCGCDSKQPAVTTAPITTAPAVDAAETLGVPATADFGGAEYNVLSAGNLTYKDFTFEESSSMPLDNAQYKRKTLVEQNYNIVINGRSSKRIPVVTVPDFKHYIPLQTRAPQTTPSV